MQIAPPDISNHNPIAGIREGKTKMGFPDKGDSLLFVNRSNSKKHNWGRSVSRMATLFDWSNQGQEMVSCAQEFKELDPGSGDTRLGEFGIRIFKLREEREVGYLLRVAGRLVLLLIYLTALAVRRVRVVWRIGHLSVALINHATARSSVLTRHLAVSGLIPDRGQLRTDTARVGGRLTGLRRIARARSINLVGLRSLSSSSTFTLLGGLALSLFLLLASLPLFANFLEF